MEMILQVLVNGMIAGSFYALNALGFTLIVRTNKFLHLAHGGVILVGIYSLYGFYEYLSLNFFLSSFLTILSSAIVGYIIYEIAYKPLKNKNSSSSVLLLVSIIVLFVIQNIILLLVGGNIKNIHFLESIRMFNINNIIITPLDFSVIVGAFVMFGLIYFIITKTELGLLFRAVSDNSELAKMRGVNINKIYVYTFIIGSAIAGYLSIFIAVNQSLKPTMGLHLIMKGLTASVIGGLYSLPGAILGGYFLGLSEDLVVWFLPSGFQELFTYFVLFFCLALKPKGILSYKK